MPGSAGGRAKRVRFAPLALVAGVAGAAVLGLGATGTLSAFTASIQNSTDNAVMGTVVMKETGLNSTGTSVTCLSTDNQTANASTCGSINKFGGSAMLPGTPLSTTVNISNTGSSPASTFTLAPGTCSYTSSSSSLGTATDICSKMTITILYGSSNTQIWTGTLSTFATTYGGTNSPLALPSASIPTAGGAAVPFTFTVQLPAGSGNSYQGETASLPLTWNFSAGS